jgi:hypothetical protein
MLQTRIIKPAEGAYLSTADQAPADVWRRYEKTREIVYRDQLRSPIRSQRAHRAPGQRADRGRGQGR